MAELFERFEVDRVPRWPLLSRLVALSVVLHGAFFVAAAYVPTLRSLLSVAGTMSGFKIVSEDYDRTLIGRRATIVKLEPYEKLVYPADYFGAPPEQPMTFGMDPMLVQQAPPLPPPPPVISYGPRVRRPKAAPTPTPEPSPSPEVAEVIPTPTPTAEEEAAQKKADEELDRIAKENGVKRPPTLNTKPFEDLAKEGKKLADEGKLNLNSAIEVAATGPLNADGTLDVPKVNVEWKTISDPNTEALAQQLLTALSQSRILGILEGAQAVRMELKLDEQNVSVRIISDLPSEDIAGQYATGYGVLLGVARMNKKGTNEGELYNRLKVDRSGKQFVMSFDMPKADAGKMISEMLAKKAKGEAAAAANGKG
ncbi:MAG TPA: hypothetical protein VGX48_27640 [Pyrinomonadaceae bacterium]|jgi:hypothetical protein|nr:hypothetical protein [Pyrinomonadaceae bacterium]